MTTNTSAKNARRARRSPRDGDTTRHALVEAATTLFAAQGIDGASIRSINSAAGLGPAAVHYHFGTKDGLLQAVLERDGGEVMARIEANEQALFDRTAPPTAREIVEILGAPYLDLLRKDPVRGARWLKIVAELSQADDDRIVQFAEAATERLRELARKAFPEATEQDVLNCLPIAFISLLVLMARAPRAASGALDEHVGLVFEFVTGGLQAILGTPQGDSRDSRPRAEGAGKAGSSRARSPRATTARSRGAS